MAVELCSDNSGMSPRISFSNDICQFDVVPVEQHPLRSKSSGLNSSIDFDFCVHESLEQESSSADELFSEGKILPADQIKKKNVSGKSSSPKTLPLSDSVGSNDANMNKNSKKEKKITRDETGEDVEIGKQSSKSFWGFKRSSSLNCGSGYGRSLCPLPLLSRSNSTGSVPNVKEVVTISKDSHAHNHKHYSQKQPYKSSSTSYQKKPPLRKNFKPYYGGSAVQVNPILNVPSGNLFGLGSVFFNGKDKNHRKK